MAAALAPAKTFGASCVLVIASTFALPFVTGYGTNLFQLVVGGAWSIVAAVASDAYADLAKALVWFPAGILNVLLFGVPAAAILLATRRSRASLRNFALLSWLVVYEASLLVRTIKNATVIASPSVPAGEEMLKSGKADVFAANKANLFELSDKLPGSRVLDGRIGVDEVAIALPKGRDTGMAYVRKYIEDAKSEGLIKAAVQRAGLRGATDK
jgi:ABC-type amino acid transport substrate-binding protein